MMKIISNSEGFHLSVFETGKNGPSVCISGSVHGNESCGIHAISRLEEQLSNQIDLLSGRLFTLVANLEAVKLNKRFIDFDLNRCFNNDSAYGHEMRLSRSIKPYLFEIDYLLDLHSTSASTVPFCAGIDTKNHLLVFEMLSNFNWYTQGWEVHRKHSMLVNEVDRLGGVGIIAECGRTGDLETSKNAYHAILNLLSGLGMISLPKRNSSITRRLVHIEEIIKAETDSFAFVNCFENFHEVKANEIIAHDGDKAISFDKKILIVMPTQGKLQAGDEGFGLGVIDSIYL